MSFTVFAVVFVLAVAFGLFINSWRNRWSDVPRAGYYKSKRLTSMAQVKSLRFDNTIVTQRNVLIIDVSRWQGTIDFIKMWVAGAWGVIIKCGQGLGLDPQFGYNWSMAKFAKLRRGSYWYYDSRVDPKEQARLWAEAIAKDSGELPHFADYEETYHGKFEGITHFTTFLLEFQKLSKLPDSRIGVYTGFYYWFDNGATDSYFNRFWLWLAWYADAEAVQIPRPWTQERLLLWQFTDQGDGLHFGAESKELDMNFFVPGAETFEEFYGDYTEYDGNSGETMNAWYRVRATAGLNIRKDAGGAKTGALPYGYVVEALEKRNGWVRIGRVFNGSAEVALQPPNDPNNAWLSDAYLVETDPPVTDPTPEPEPDPEPLPPGVKHVINVFDNGAVQVDDGEVIP